MQQNILIIAFVFIVALCLVNTRYYLLVVLAGIAAMAIFRPERSNFEAEAAQEPPEPDLDSSQDIDDVLSTRPEITNGDDLLMRQMQVVAGKSKEAILARSRFTSDNFRRYFQEELDAAEHQHWWEDDSLSEGTVKDGRHYESDTYTETEPEPESSGF